MKKKDYLNKSESVNFITIGAALSSVDKMLEISDDKEKTYLKYLKTYISKYQNEVFSRLTENNKKRLFNTVDTHYVEIVPKTSRSIKKAIVDIEYLSDLAEITIEEVCKKCDGNKNECKLREALKGCFVPESNNDNDVCCYSYK